MTRLLTPVGVLSYPHLFKAILPRDAKAGDKPKFSTAILFDAAAVETPEYRALAAAVLAIARERWGDKADAMIQEGSIRLPFRKDVVAKGYPDRFVRFFNCTAPEDHPPQIVGRYAGADGKPEVITDMRAIYPGVFARVSVNPFAYDQRGNKGVAFGLGNVQKWGDGDRLAGGGADASAEFAAEARPEVGGDALRDLVS